MVSLLEDMGQTRERDTKKDGATVHFSTEWFFLDVQPSPRKKIPFCGSLPRAKKCFHGGSKRLAAAIFYVFLRCLSRMSQVNYLFYHHLLAMALVQRIKTLRPVAEDGRRESVNLRTRVKDTVKEWKRKE